MRPEAKLELEHHAAGFYIVTLTCGVWFRAFEFVSSNPILREWRLKRSKARLMFKLNAMDILRTQPEQKGE